METTRKNQQRNFTDELKGFKYHIIQELADLIGNGNSVVFKTKFPIHIDYGGEALSNYNCIGVRVYKDGDVVIGIETITYRELEWVNEEVVMCMTAESLLAILRHVREDGSLISRLSLTDEQMKAVAKMREAFDELTRLGGTIVLDLDYGKFFAINTESVDLLSQYDTTGEDTLWSVNQMDGASVIGDAYHGSLGLRRK